MSTAIAPLTGTSGLGRIIGGMMGPLAQRPASAKSGFAPLGQNPLGAYGKGISTAFGSPLNATPISKPFSLGSAEKFGDVDLGSFGRLGISAYNASLGSGSALGGAPATNAGGGTVTNAGGDWALLDQSNPEITAAATKLGVPPNLLKAMINNESSGNWNGDGSRVVYLKERNDYILPFVGITKNAADSWGLNWQGMIGNKQAQIDGMATILNGLYRQYGSWDNAIKAYFGGQAAVDGEWQDENQLGSGYYYDKTMKNWKFLDEKGGFTGTGSGTGGISSISPTGTVESWGVFGGESNLGYYEYGNQYGLNGTQHTGADVKTPRGSVYYAPSGGVVTCAGTGVGPGADGGGCAAFGDTGGGAGRVEVLLDNGTVVIYGHSSEALVQPGQRVNAGQAIGKSGTMNSDHIHLETRVRDASMPSGWRIVDPSSVLGGGAGSVTGGGTTPAATGSELFNAFRTF